MTRSWTPSPQQLVIFDDIAHGNGHTVTIARAGSGKTSTVIAGLDHIPSQIRRSDVLLVAFNKSIAKELQKRAPPEVVVQTLHGYGLRRIGNNLPGRPAVDPDKLNRIISGLTSNRDTKAELRELVPLCKANLAHKPNAIGEVMDSAGIFPVEGSPEELIDLTRRALKLSREDLSCVDFDDMIWLPNLFEWQPARYSRVFIDELQDLNKAQIRLALGACMPGGRILGVGDDLQSIYAFRGADAEAIPNVVEELAAKTLPLTTTYRCARAITSLAQKYAPDLRCPEDVPLGAVRDLEGYEEIVRRARPGDFVLSRTNAPLIRLCFAFIRAGVRGVMVQGRNIGARLAGLVKKSGAGNVAELLGWVEKWRIAETERLEKLDRDSSGVIDMAAATIVICEGCGGIGDVREKIDRIFTDDAPSERRIVLSSVHQAKGLERDRVWLLRDTFLRGARWRDEETGEVMEGEPAQEEINIFYVAVTRAKSELNLVWDVKER